MPGGTSSSVKPSRSCLARRARLDVRLDPLDLLGTERTVLNQVSAEFRAGRTSDHDDTSSQGGPWRISISRRNWVITLYFAWKTAPTFMPSSRATSAGFRHCFGGSHVRRPGAGLRRGRARAPWPVPAARGRTGRQPVPQVLAGLDLDQHLFIVDHRSPRGSLLQLGHQPVGHGLEVAAEASLARLVFESLQAA